MIHDSCSISWKNEFALTWTFSFALLTPPLTRLLERLSLSRRKCYPSYLGFCYRSFFFQGRNGLCRRLVGRIVLKKKKKPSRHFKIVPRISNVNNSSQLPTIATQQDEDWKKSLERVWKESGVLRERLERERELQLYNTARKSLEFSEIGVL